MRSGWQHPSAQEEQRRQASFGPEVSWPTGYQDLEYRDDAYSYPEGDAAGGHARQARGEMPYGEHPYAVSGPAADFGYGDPGYSDPRYEGPAYQGAAYQDARDREPDQGRIGNQWSGAYPTLPGAANDPRYDDPRLDPFAQPGYDPGYGAAGYGDSGYGDSGYGHSDPGYGQPGPGAVTGERTRFDMPVYDETEFDETRYDMPRYDEPRRGGPSGSAPAFGQPAFDEPAFGGPQAFSGADDYDRPPVDDRTRYDMPVLSAPVVESAGFDVDVYRDPDLGQPGFGSGSLDGFGSGAFPSDGFSLDGFSSDGFSGGFPSGGFPGADGFDQPRGSVLPHTGMMLAVPDAPPLALGAAQEADAFDSRILEKTGAFEAATFDVEPRSRGGVSDTMLDMQGAALLKEISGAPGLDEDLRERHGAADPAGKRAGKRRGGSRDHRQWIAIGAIVVVAAGAVAGGMKLAFPSHSGPTHTMATPANVGAYTRKANLETQMNVQSLVDSVRKMSNGEATNLVSAVYQAGSMTPGGQPQIFMFIGGHLNNADPSASISSFEAKYAGAKTVSAGAMGGEAACVEVTAGAQGNAAMCIWFDNDSFGELVSSTMNTGTLQNVMTSVRPSLEHVAKV